MRDGKLDNNTVIGFLLIGAILLFFSYFGNDSIQPENEEGAISTSVDSVTTKSQTTGTAELAVYNDSAVSVQDSTITIEFGTFGDANNPNAKEEIFVLENEVVELKISSRGGQIVSARLKEYQTWDSLPLHIIDKNSAFDIALSADGKIYNSNTLNFVGEKTNGGDLMFTLQSKNGGTLKYRYSLKPNNYLVDLELISRDFNDYLPSDVALTFEMKTFRHEKNQKAEKQATELNYRFLGEDVDNLSATSDDEATEEKLSWVAFKQQFFSTIIWNQDASFDKVGLISTKVSEDDETHTKLFASKMSLSKSDGELNTHLGMYLGPNKYDILEGYEQKFDKLIPLGWGILGWINRGIIINVFDWLEGYGLGYGLIIFIIALLIKLILFPLTFSSYKSMAKMRVLKPEIDELNAKFEGKEAVKKQQATMALYQKAGVNPLGGCIPMVLQFPILIALFRFFPSSIELRQQPFLWATDLSTYDSIYDFSFEIWGYGDHISLFTLLMTVSTLIYTYMNQQLTGQNQQFPQLKYMVYLMPVVFLGVFNNYAAGLSYYYFLANMITFGQQFAIRKYLNEEKILLKIQEKKKQPKKENRIMRRMKDIQEQQEVQQKSRQDRRKK